MDIINVKYNDLLKETLIKIISDQCHEIHFYILVTISYHFWQQPWDSPYLSYHFWQLPWDSPYLSLVTISDHFHEIHL